MCTPLNGNNKVAQAFNTLSVAFALSGRIYHALQTILTSYQNEMQPTSCQNRTEQNRARKPQSQKQTDRQTPPAPFWPCHNLLHGKELSTDDKCIYVMIWIPLMTARLIVSIFWVAPDTPLAHRQIEDLRSWSEGGECGDGESTFSAPPSIRLLPCRYFHTLSHRYWFRFGSCNWESSLWRI